MSLPVRLIGHSDEVAILKELRRMRLGPRKEQQVILSWALNSQTVFLRYPFFYFFFLRSQGFRLKYNGRK
ncbi:MAG: hypothetical protein D8M57_10160 [Candidatus Scalindua sp. AMX11]|nr:MAG: hypothetical protein D8M57_10160 [Candidatus Scalindua sp. AMX11]